MRNLKASPRVPFPQLPFSFGDKPVRQTTRRWRWGAGGGVPAASRGPVGLWRGALYLSPSLRVASRRGRVCGSLRMRGQPATLWCAGRDLLCPPPPRPLTPLDNLRTDPHTKAAAGSERLTSVPRPRPQHKEPRKQLASWGPGRGPSQLQSHPERARRAPSTPHVGCFQRAPRSLGPDAPMGRGPTGARGGSRARPSAGFIPPARDGPPPLTSNTLGACPRGRDTLRRRASPAGRAGSPGESRLTPGAGRPVSALPGSPPSSATFAVQDATARST